LGVFGEIYGPETIPGFEIKENENITGSTSVTYPAFSTGFKIICDRYHAKTIGNRSIFIVADGCNWGERPREAAIRATQGLIEYFSKPEVQNDINDTIQAKNHLLRAVSYMHKKIIEGKQDIWQAAQTTAICGILLKLDENFLTDEWALVLLSVGDCKAYHYDIRTKDVFEITYGNRRNVRDARDCGGRLGPYLNAGLPDLRNLEVYFHPCHAGDILIVVSDGVHDNLDPESLGLIPKDLSRFNIGQYKTWDEVPMRDAIRVKSQYSCQYMKGMLDSCKEESPSEYTNIIVDHCIKTTDNSRKWMEQNPDKAEPKDYKNFPGKMDHATCLSLRVNDSNELRRKSIIRKNKRNVRRDTKRKKKEFDMDKMLENYEDKFTRIKVKSSDMINVMSKIYGPPKGTEKIQKITNCTAGWTISTYPIEDVKINELENVPDNNTKKGKIRNNDPIVECFGIETLVDKCICVVTSCKNYGPSCKETSALARNTFLETLREEKNTYYF